MAIQSQHTQHDNKNHFNKEKFVHFTKIAHTHTKKWSLMGKIMNVLCFIDCNFFFFFYILLFSASLIEKR